MHQASGIFAPSGPIADSLRTTCPALTDRIERIHIGSFVEDQCACFSSDRNVAGFIVVHPLNSAKLFEPFLNAVRHLVLDGSDIMVALMGSGKAERAIREHIWKLGLTSIVTVVPPIRPMRNILSGTDVYVHLRDNPAFDAQLLEAMAVGLAVVGTPETSSGLLEDGHTAMFWDCEDELNIYACLKKIVGMREQTRQLARNAQAHLREHNSVSHMVDKLMNTYTRAQQWYSQNRQTMLKTTSTPPAQ
jgi:glycosyltransferase involved in cell wall biosynthesis